MSEARSSSRRRRALRSDSLPPTEADRTVPYAECRTEFAGYGDADFALDVVAHPAYQHTVAPLLDGVDRRSKGRRGGSRFYSSQELELLLIYTRVAGFPDYSAARQFLAGDRGAAHRSKMGFDRARDKTPGRRRTSLDGVPTEKSIARHLARFQAGERAAIFDAAWTALRDTWLESLEARDECRELSLDGSLYATHYKAPNYDIDGNPIPRTRIDWRTKEVVNAITCPDGGRRGGGDAAHAGDGWNFVALVTRRGRPLTYVLDTNDKSEKAWSGPEILRRYDADIRPLLRPTELAVLSADGGFNSPQMRNGCRELGIVPNIKLVSGNKTDAAERHRSRLLARRYKLKGAGKHSAKWTVDGFRNLHCECGAGTTVQRCSLHPDGHAVIRVEGQCRHGCGSLTITNGRWRVSTDGTHIVPRHPDDPPSDEDDALFGNPLTDTNPVARALGSKRFGKHEGFHSQLHTRFRLLEGKSWLRRRDQAHQEVALTLLIMWILSDIQAKMSTARAHAGHAERFAARVLGSGSEEERAAA